MAARQAVAVLRRCISSANNLLIGHCKRCLSLKEMPLHENVFVIVFEAMLMSSILHALYIYHRTFWPGMLPPPGQDMRRFIIAG